MCVVVHGEVRQPGPGVRVHNDLIAAVDVDDDVLAGHTVLVVVLVVLVEDGCDLLTCKTKINDTAHFFYLKTVHLQ